MLWSGVGSFTIRVEVSVTEHPVHGSYALVPSVMGLCSLKGVLRETHPNLQGYF